MRDFKIFVSIADLHIGRSSISAEAMKTQLKTHFIKVLKKMKYLDGIFILGDIMHTIVSLNSEYAELFYWFIDQVYKVARKKCATVIIVKGTPSHDNDQLNNIKHYQMNDDGVDFRIYETVEETTVWDDYKVLVLPDVKVKQLKEVDKYLDEPGRYDLILGHGVTDSARFFVQESENMSAKTYVFDVDKLLNACNGPIHFGHIHQYQSIQNKFYYAGPFTLLERGGDSAGFLVTGIYNKDRTKFKVEFYENPDTAHYYELVVSKDVIDNYPIDEIIGAIDDIVENAKSNDLVSLKVTRGNERDSADKVIMLEDRYRKDRRFSITKKVKSKTEEETEQKNEERKKKYAYVLDENLSLSTIMYQFYVEDVLPTMPEQQQHSDAITEAEFRRILGEKDEGNE